MPQHSQIPIEKRIHMRKLFEMVEDSPKGNRLIAEIVGLRTIAVFNYRKSHAEGIHAKRVDIPFEKLSPRAKRLVIQFGSKTLVV